MMHIDSPSLRLDGKTALVTGAGRGLGQAIADRLAELGATVYGTSRATHGADAIAARYGTMPLAVDVGDATAIQTAVDRMTNERISVDLLVNNAGINIPQPAVDVTAETWDRVLEVNLRGTFLFSTALAREWIRTRRPGAIVNVASQAGLVAIEDRAAYGASKAGLLHLTKSLALEWAPHGIRVNAVAPTFIRTALTATLDDGAIASELLSRIPLGRFGEPHDVAGPVAFLLSDAAAMITGHTLVIDGGYTIR